MIVITRPRIDEDCYKQTFFLQNKLNSFKPIS